MMHVYSTSAIYKLVYVLTVAALVDCAVVDIGYVKTRLMSPQTGVEMLKVITTDHH